MSAFKSWHSLNLYKIWSIQTDRLTDRQTDHPTYRTTEAPPELKKGISTLQMTLEDSLVSSFKYFQIGETLGGILMLGFKFEI